jgi:hypothetical protein
MGIEPTFSGRQPEAFPDGNRTKSFGLRFRQPATIVLGSTWVISGDLTDLQTNRFHLLICKPCQCQFWCSRRDLNPHSLYKNLVGLDGLEPPISSLMRRVCLPITPETQIFFFPKPLSFFLYVFSFALQSKVLTFYLF